MDQLLQDLRLALRTLRRNPGYTAVALLTLALGIGANTAVFSLVNAVLVRPLPFPAADRLTVLWGTRGGAGQLLVAYADVEDWRQQSRTFQDISAVRSLSVNLTGGEEPQRLVGSFVTPGFFPMLGGRAAQGRLFSSAEAARGSPLVAVISHATWRNRFGADSAVIGRAITLNGRPYVVVGVTAADFQDPWRATEVWLPMATAPDTWFQRGVQNVWALGRLKSGVTPAEAKRDLDAISTRLAALYPASNAGLGAKVITLRESVAGRTGDALRVLLAFVAVLLVIACVNVANLQLARAAARTREMSLRAALGAGRARLIRQLLTESGALALLGGAGGMLLAAWTTQALAAGAPGGLPAFGAVGVDGTVLAFCTVITVVTGVVFGAVPAGHGSRPDLAAALNERHPGSGPARRFEIRSTLVSIQLALCVTLLVGAGLLLRSLVALQRVDLGFNPASVLSAEFRLPAVKYTTPEQIATFMGRAIANVRATPGVRSAALVRSVPLSGNFGTVTYEVDGRPAPSNALAPAALENDVTPGFFGTMQIAIHEGRDFDDRDRGADQVAIVNDVLARRAWPGQSALGKRIKLFGPPDAWVTVVGVVATIKQRTVGEEPEVEIYRPIAQQPYIFTSVVARTDGDPAALTKSVRAAVWAVDPDQPVWRIAPFTSFISAQLATPTFTLTLTALSALLALALAGVGVYGVMSYVAQQRTREVGIRMALGARQSQIIGLFLSRGGRIIAIGSGVGLLAALGGAKLLRAQQQLYGIATIDAPTFALVPIILAAVAMLACYLPARRAALVDPAVTLRGE